MSDHNVIVNLTQQQGYQFKIDFGQTVPAIFGDEPAPLDQRYGSFTRSITGCCSGGAQPRGALAGVVHVSALAAEPAQGMQVHQRTQMEDQPNARTNLLPC